jgi:hypothetical protein
MDKQMKSKPESRMTVFANLWCRYGCPERMKIHVKSTGETITLINGLPVTDNAENNPLLMRSFKPKNRELGVGQPVTDNCVCLACKRSFYSKRGDAKYCSARCRQKARREQEAKEARLKLQKLLA